MSVNAQPLDGGRQPLQHRNPDCPFCHRPWRCLLVARGPGYEWRTYTCTHCGDATVLLPAACLAGVSFWGPWTFTFTGRRLMLGQASQDPLSKHPLAELGVLAERLSRQRRTPILRGIVRYRRDLWRWIRVDYGERDQATLHTYTKGLGGPTTVLSRRRVAGDFLALILSHGKARKAEARAAQEVE